jgi:hypothetical protein
MTQDVMCEEYDNYVLNVEQDEADMLSSPPLWQI